MYPEPSPAVSWGLGLPEHSLFAPCPEAVMGGNRPGQSCPTLCDPIDGSPPGSPVLGILQARTLEWVATRTVRRLFLILSYPLPPLLSFSITKGIERHAGKSVSGSPCSHHPCEHRANWVSSESRLRCELPGEGQGDWTVRNHPALLWRCFGAAQGSRTPAARSSFGDRTGDGTAWLLHLAAMGSCPRFAPGGKILSVLFSSEHPLEA